MTTEQHPKTGTLSVRHPGGTTICLTPDTWQSRGAGLKLSEADIAFLTSVAAKDTYRALRESTD